MRPKIFGYSHNHSCLLKILSQYLPPSLISVVAWIISWSFLAKHWYIPRSSLCTDVMLRRKPDDMENALLLPPDTPSRNGIPSLAQWRVGRGSPELVQVKFTFLPRSIFERGLDTCTVKGCNIWSSCSTRSLPAELLTAQT